MKHLKTLVLVVAVTSAISDASAQEFFNRSWYVVPSLNKLEPDTDFGVNKRGDGAGLRFGSPINDSWDFQLGGSYSRAKQSGMRYQQDMLGVDWLYMFSRDTFRPFLLAGIGAERDKVTRPFVSSNRTSPYLTAGVGFQWDFSDRWGTQVDYRRVHGRLRDNSLGINRSDNDYLTLGLVYRFDSMPRRARQVAMTPEPVRAAEPVYTPPPVMPRPDPVIAAAPPPPPAPPRFERFVLSATELFQFDRADLASPQPKLDEIATALNNSPQISNVVVSGHTDRLGSDGYNMELSQRRAEIVKSYLVSKGVAANRITAQGRGETVPVVQCQDRNRADLIKCLEPNRRVEVEQIAFERRVS